MGNVIPWSQIHPSIKSEEPFVAVIIVDPLRQICISEHVTLDELSLGSGDVAAPATIAAAQQGAARVASAYRARRKADVETPGPTPGTAGRRPRRTEAGGLRVLNGGLR